MFRNMYQGRRVFVTGHTGFKGSWICAWLTSLGAEVMGYSCDIPPQPSHIEAMHLGEHIRQVQGDIRDRDALIRAMKEFKPDVVFHLAAQALVRKSYDEPVLTFESNVMGTMNVLEAVRACPSVGAVVMITSDKCYRNDEQVWGYRETDHLGGYDPYSASKGCAEIVAHSYFRSFFRNGPACATVRAGNVIGGGDWASTVSSRTVPVPGPRTVLCRSGAPTPQGPGSSSSNPFQGISGSARFCSWALKRPSVRSPFPEKPIISALPRM